MLASIPSRRSLELLGAAVVAGGLAGAAFTAGVRRERRESKRLHRTLVQLLLNTLSSGDPVTARHSLRVADLTDALAEALALPPREQATLRVAALLHDMGKIDDRFFHIIHSRSPLSKRQRAEIKQHPCESAHILEPLEPVHPEISRIVASHHECWNGSGYPNGRAGEEIPLAARIISVADVFDAVTQPRAYHDPLSVEEAFEVLREDAGSKFDPAIVALLDRAEVRKRWAQIARSGLEEEERVQGRA